MQVRTYKYKNVARFGLMHMVATNLCVWVLTVILESKFEIQQLDYPNIFHDYEPLSIGDHPEIQVLHGEFIFSESLKFDMYVIGTGIFL